MSGGGIAGDNYFILKARGDEENALTESVTVTNTYQAEGALMLSGDKVLRGGELAADEFEFVLDSTGANADPDFRVKYPDGCAVKNESDGTFTFPSIEYDYADAGKTYVYTPVSYTHLDVYKRQVIGLYSDDNCTREVARAATDGPGYANFVVEPNTTYWYKEISTISGYDISGVKGTFISPTYGGKQESYPVIFDPAYRLVTLKKLDASGNPVAGVKLRITMADGSAVKDPNGNVLTGMTLSLIHI